MRERSSKPAPVGVISKVLRVLELLDSSPTGLQLKDVAEGTHINKSTAYRFLSHLEAEGYLFRDADSAYMLGPKLVRMGDVGSLPARLRAASRPVLERLGRQTGETVNLAVLDGSEVLYLDVLASQPGFQQGSHVGMRRPVFRTSMGKAMLALDPRTKAVSRILASMPQQPEWDRELHNRPRFKRELAWIRERGYALDNERAEPGARCIGTAILGGDGAVLGAISICGPTLRITREQVPAFSDAILSGAREVAERFQASAGSTA